MRLEKKHANFEYPMFTNKQDVQLKFKAKPVAVVVPFTTCYPSTV